MLPREDDTLSLGLHWVHIGAELEGLLGSKLLTDLDQFLESRSTGREEQQIISIAKCSN